MNDYKELIERFRWAVEFHKSERMPCDLAITPETCTKAADAIEQLVKERDELRNELCLRCGEYTEAHNGACDGCKWRVN